MLQSLLDKRIEQWDTQEIDQLGELDKELDSVKITKTVEHLEQDSRM